jgi:FkbM family methyltransferase
MEKLMASSIHKCEWEAQRKLLNGKANTIFDVGANRGDSTSKYVELFPEAHIHAFEPFHETCEKFRGKHGSRNNIRLNECALSSKVGSAILNVNSSVDTNSILESTRIGATSDASCKTVGKVEIETDTIDRYCESNGIDCIDILKIDVQGFELEVLEGSINLLENGRIKIIYVETYFEQQYIGQPLFYEIAGLLRRYGYVLKDTYDPYYSAMNLLWCDSIFINKAHFS